MVNFKIAAIVLLLTASGASAQQQPYGFGYQGYGYQGYGPVMVVPPQQQFPQDFDKDFIFYSRIHQFDGNHCWGGGGENC